MIFVTSAKLYICLNYLSRNVNKGTFGYVRPAKIKISLGILHSLIRIF